MLPHFIAGLMQRYPILQNEYVQVLAVVVTPLVLLLGCILFELSFRKSAVRSGAITIFTPSLTIRSFWLVLTVGLAIQGSYSAGTHYLVATADFALVFELLRTFPSTIRIRNNGIQWSSLLRTVNLPWENIYCFVHRKSKLALLDEDYRLYGTGGERLVIAPSVYSDSKGIVRQVATHLRQRDLIPSSAEPQSMLDRVHGMISIASGVIIVLGRYVR